MAKFYGMVGYSETVESKPGVWTDEITERLYTGDIIQLSRSLRTSEGLNDNIELNEYVSVVADPYAMGNFMHIKYVEVRGIKWKIRNVEVQSPRLLLTLGEMYNE